MAITAKSTVEIRRANGNAAWVVVSEQPVGVAAYSFSDVARQRPIPSIAPVLAVQQLDVRDGRFGITIDDNSLTNPLLFMRSGKEFEVRLRREGAGPGLRQVVMSGPVTVNLTNAAGGVRTFRFDLQVEKLNESTQ